MRASEIQEALKSTGLMWQEVPAASREMFGGSGCGIVLTPEIRTPTIVIVQNPNGLSDFPWAFSDDGGDTFGFNAKSLSALIETPGMLEALAQATNRG